MAHMTMKITCPFCEFPNLVIVVSREKYTYGTCHSCAKMFKINSVEERKTQAALKVLNSREQSKVFDADSYMTRLRSIHSDESHEGLSHDDEEEQAQRFRRKMRPADPPVIPDAETLRALREKWRPVFRARGAHGMDSWESEFAAAYARGGSSPPRSRAYRYSNERGE